VIAIAGDRTVLLNIFARRVAPSNNGILVSSVEKLPNCEVTAIFQDRAGDGELPHTLIVDVPNLREFYAWAATYLGHWSPLTSSVRVLKKANLSRAQLTEPVPFELSLRLRRGLFSLIIGEALCEWKLAGGSSAPTLLSLRSTFGYAAMQAIRRKWLDSEKLFNDWERAQRMLKLGPRRIERDTFLSVWEAIGFVLLGERNLADNPGQLGQLLREVVETSRLPFARFGDTLPLLSQTELHNVNQRREDAVIYLEEWLAKHPLDTPLNSFLAACLAARLSQSALTHFDVLASMTKVDVESLLWYSFVSGLLASDPSSQVNERLMYRLMNEFGRNMNAPRCDVALDELEVLVQSDGGVPPWVGIGGGYLSVEVDTDIYAWFRVRDRASGSLAGRYESTSVDHDAMLFEELLGQMRTLYHRKATPSPNKKRRRK
jgi:hypothetical protein